MLYDKFIISNMPPEIISGQVQGSHESAWVGALSGEDRCSASVSTFAQLKLRFTHGLLLDYEAELEQPPDAKQAISRQRDLLTNMGRSLFRQEIQTRPISPYSFQDFQAVLENILLEWAPDFILFDITCLTKIHLLALAAALARYPRVPAWAAVYAKPETYLALEHAPGWRDIIIAPLGDTGFLLNEAFSRGIILPGHEGDRLVVAMSEMEASGGVILIADTPGRPDLRQVTEDKNRKMFQRLTRSGTGEWIRRTVRDDKPADISRCVAGEIEIAESHSAPIMLFPYGPKSLVFIVARHLSSLRADWSWFVYPIPRGRVAEFSEGVERITWIVPAEAGTVET